MSSIGPELPPHLAAKRKRQLEEEEAGASSAAQTKADIKSRSSSPDVAEKRKRVIGPAPPPAPLEERPPQPATGDGDDSSSSDDDFGPALPGKDSATAAAAAVSAKSYEEDACTPDKPARDEWMMLPPKQDDLAARMDPTKLRARKFNTGRLGRPPAQSTGEVGASWLETPEQKRKRLEDEVMGVSAPSSTSTQDRPNSQRDKEAEETKRRIAEMNEKMRGKSLVEEHKKKHKEKEDDPSKRAFDREKDMALGGQVGYTKRKEMLNKAADFGSRFSGGGYL